MKTPEGTRAVRRWLFGIGLGVAVVGLGSGRAPVSRAASGPTTAPDRANEAAAAPGAASPGAAGLKVFVDPATGRPTGEPTAAARAALEAATTRSLGNALSTSSDGLIRIASPVAGGGVMVRLEGRFQSASVAHAEPGAAPRIDCRGSLPGDSHSDERR